ncbi:DUF3592 domain-containing protein [Plantactinospora siamensis]|uniref:DUF3592 domain-containing protein n=1 Tax=Plantactinospora siamensis TaxID=555372 RepID=A0ABV6NVR9_9ACTN
MGVVVVIGFAIATYQIWSNDNALRDRGRQASATVIKVHSGKAGRTVVQFSTAEGRQLTALIGQGDGAPGWQPRVGDEVPIVYDPQKPTADVRDARAPENHHTAYFSLAVTIFGAIAVPIAAVALIRANRRDREG